MKLTTIFFSSLFLTSLAYAYEKVGEVGPLTCEIDYESKNHSITAPRVRQNSCSLRFEYPNFTMRFSSYFDIGNQLQFEYRKIKNNESTKLKAYVDLGLSKRYTIRHLYLKKELKLYVYKPVTPNSYRYRAQKGTLITIKFTDDKTIGVFQFGLGKKSQRTYSKYISNTHTHEEKLSAILMLLQHFQEDIWDGDFEGEPAVDFSLPDYLIEQDQRVVLEEEQNTEQSQGYGESTGRDESVGHGEGEGDGESEVSGVHQSDDSIDDDNSEADEENSILDERRFYVPTKNPVFTTPYLCNSKSVFSLNTNEDMCRIEKRVNKTIFKGKLLSSKGFLSGRVDIRESGKLNIKSYKLRSDAMQKGVFPKVIKLHRIAFSNLFGDQYTQINIEELSERSIKVWTKVEGKVIAKSYTKTHSFENKLGAVLSFIIDKSSKLLK